MLVVSVHSCSLYRRSAQSAHTFDTSCECFKADSSIVLTSVLGTSIIRSVETLHRTNRTNRTNRP